MKNFLFSSLLCIMLLAPAVAQQIPLYSEMYFLRMLYNPALTSYNGSTDIFGFYRDQWTGIPGHPVTAGALGDMSLWDDRIGVGFHVYEDNTSIIHRTDAQLYYAQKIQIAQDHVISLGVSGGIMNTYIDFANAVAADPNDPSLLANAKGGLGFDMNVGLAYQWKEKLTIGFSVPQVLNNSVNIGSETNTTVYQMQRHFIGSASYEISFSDEKFNLEPCVMVTKGPEQPVQVDGSLTFNYKRILFLGVGYRMDYGFSAMAAVRIDRAVTLGYAFDAPFTMQAATLSQTKGTHEIILGITFDRWLKKRTREEAKQEKNLQKQIDSLKADNQQIHKSIDTINQRLDSLQLNTDSLMRNVDSVKQNVDSLKQNMNLLKQTGVIGTEQQMHEQAQESKNQSHQMKEMQERIDSFETLVMQYKTNITQNPIENFPATVTKKTKTTKGSIYRLNSVSFERNSSYLKKVSYAELDKVVDFLKSHPTMHIRINGHTDNTSSDKYNQWLSDRRAKRVYDYLVKKGIESGRMQYIGFGRRMPIASNDTDEGRAKNRRVEIQILKQ